LVSRARPKKTLKLTPACVLINKAGQHSKYLLDLLIINQSYFILFYHWSSLVKSFSYHHIIAQLTSQLL